MSLRVFLATAIVASLTKADDADWACEDISTEETYDWGETTNYYWNCNTNESKDYSFNDEYSYTNTSYYDGLGYQESRNENDWGWTEYRSWPSDGDKSSESYYWFEEEEGSYYSSYDGTYDYHYNNSEDGARMSDSDKEQLKEDITAAVANTIGKIALDSINMKSEHKSIYQSEPKVYNKGGKDAFNWGWLALALFGTSAVYCGFQAVRSRKTDDKTDQLSSGFLVQPA